MMRPVREGWEGQRRLKGLSVGSSLLVVLLLQLFLPAHSFLPGGRGGPFARAMSNREQVSYYYEPRLVRCGRQRNVARVKMAWEEYFDGTTGLPYYYNSATGKTTWEKPAVEKPKLGGGTTTVFRAGSTLSTGASAAPTGSDTSKRAGKGGTRVVSREAMQEADATAERTKTLGKPRPGGGIGSFFGGGTQLFGVSAKSFSFVDGPATVASPASGKASAAGRAKGRPKKNQDQAVIANSLEGCGVDVFCVIDGHGPNGDSVAAWLASNIPFAMQAALTGYDRNDLSNAVQKAFLQLDADARRTLGAKSLEVSGATATVALHKDGKLLVAGLGDSRAILGGPEKSSRIQVMTAPHNPADPVERARIIKSGGEVGVFPGEPAVSETGQGRVFVAGTEYPGLATARSFGDCTAKSVGVTAEPAIQVAQVLGRRQLLIIATDGVWDVLSDNRALEIAVELRGGAGPQDAAAACDAIVQEARVIWETREGADEMIDDISALVAYLT